MPVSVDTGSSWTMVYFRQLITLFLLNPPRSKRPMTGSEACVTLPTADRTDCRTFTRTVTLNRNGFPEPLRQSFRSFHKGCCCEVKNSNFVCIGRRHPSKSVCPTVGARNQKRIEVRGEMFFKFYI